MRITPNDKKNILLAGFFILALGGVLLASVFKLSQEHSLFERMVEIHTFTDNAQNLKVGAFVQYKGIKIGSVKDVDVVSLSKIKITLKIRHQLTPWIKMDSFLSFKTQGVLGDKFLEILGGTEGAQSVTQGSALELQSAGQIEKIITKGEDILALSVNVLQKFDALMSSIGTQRFESIMNSLEISSKNLQEISTSLNTTSIKNFSNNIGPISNTLKNTSLNLEKLSQRINQGPGTIHSLIYDQSVHEDIKAILGGANRSQVLRFFIREAIKNK